MRDRPTPTNADRVFRNYQCRWQLLSLELIRRMLDFVQDPENLFRIVPGGDNFGGRGFLFEVHLQDRVHYFVWRQAVLVELVGGELGGWFLVDDLAWNDLASGFFVHVPGDLPDLGL